MLEVANLVLVVGPDATTHDIREKFRCQQCNAKGNNTYEIVWRGNSGIALDGAGVTSVQIMEQVGISKASYYRCLLAS